MRRRLFCGALVVALSGCQVTPAVQELQTENRNLKASLDRAQTQISQLERERQILRVETTELQRISTVLGQEKSSRVTESTELRGEIRQFVQAQIDSLKQFLVNSNLLDYVGGELVERPEQDERALFLVDLGNVIPQSGVITGVSGYFRRPGALSVRLLRPRDDRLVVVWESSRLNVPAAGLQRIPFRSSVGVESGDLLAYELPVAGLVGFDSGTGDVRYGDEAAPLGTTIKTTSLDGEKEKRAYSLGVFGLLNSFQ